MNDDENILSRDSDSSITNNPETAADRKMDTLSTMVENSPEERTNEASDNFESLTFVSSQGFFFQ